MNKITPPNDFNSEKTLIGQLIYSGSLGNKELNNAMDSIQEITPLENFGEHFFNTVHSKIYHLIYLNYCKQRPISSSTLSSALINDPYFQNSKAIAEAYLEDMVREAGFQSQIKELATHIIDLSVKRQLIEISNQLTNNINVDQNAMTSKDYILKLEKELSNLVVYNNYSRDFQTLNTVAQNVLMQITSNMKNKCKFSGLTTGYSQLDRMLGGMQNSDLIIIAARPAMGKTSFALCLALNVAEYMRDGTSDENKKSVGFISLEMSSEQLVTRLISVKSKINAMKIKNGNLTEDEFARVNLTLNNLRELNIVVDDNAAISIIELKSKVRKMVVKNNLSILFVDYLQLLHGNKKSSEANRVNEISEISRGLKQLAKELNIPVVALSQLSRDVEKRESKVPRLSDLRESGSIEQDADVVMFLYREEYYLKNEQRRTQDTDINVLNKAEIVIAKHRNGAIGNVMLQFDCHTTAFIDPSKYTEDDFFESDI